MEIERAFTRLAEGIRLNGVTACQETDPELWFPENRASTRIAKALCKACPVARECLEFALVSNEMHGIWGGVSVGDRREMLGLKRKNGGNPKGIPPRFIF